MSTNAPVSQNTCRVPTETARCTKDMRRRWKSKGHRRFTKNKIQCRIPTLTLKNSCKLPDQNVAFWGYFQARLPAKGGDGFSVPYGGSHMTGIQPRQVPNCNLQSQGLPSGTCGVGVQFQGHLRPGFLPRLRRIIHTRTFYFPCGLGKGPELWSHGFLGSNPRALTYWQTVLR